MKPTTIFRPCRANQITELTSNKEIDFYSILDCEGTVEISYGGGNPIHVKKGDQVHFDPADLPNTNVYVESPVDQTLRIGLGKGPAKVTTQVDDLNLTVGTVANLNQAPDGNTTPDHIVIAPGQAVQVFVADNSVDTVTVSRYDDEDHKVHVGGAGVGANSGLPLRAMGSGENRGTADLWVYNPSPTDSVIIATFMTRRSA